MAISNIVDAAFDRSKVAMLALVLLAFLGASTYKNAPREADPDVTLPFVQVLIPLPGISPQDAERLLIRPTEQEVQSLEGLIQVDATAYEGVATMRLEFQVGLDMDLVVEDVKEAVDRAKSKYPRATLEPVVEEINAQTLYPVMTVVLSSDAPERTLFEAATALKNRLTAVPGVMEVEMVGARDEVVEIVISPQSMENYALTPLEIASAIQRNNTLVTAGTLRFQDGNYAVKIPGLFKTLDDIRMIPVRADANASVTLGDIAQIKRTFEEPEGYARFNGRLAIGLDISKSAEANLLKMTSAVKAEAELAVADLPSTIHVDFIGDSSTIVNSIFSSLTASIMLAIILVMIVVIAALGLRSAMLVGIAIPASFLIGLAFIGFLGFTMNNLVMFSMVLAVGMLVDGAIVIVELADRRMAEGAPRQEAFLEASRRMFWPITASTATTLAAFVPFLFWDSIEGYFMRWIPITLILLLSASLLVALIFLPIIGASFSLPDSLRNKLGIKRQVEGREKVDLDNIDPTLLPGFTGRYARMVAVLIQRPMVTILAALGSVFLCLQYFSHSDVAVEQFIRVDSEQIMVYVEGRGNISDREALAITSLVQNKIIDHPAVEYAYLQTGPSVSRGRDAPVDGIGLISLDLIPYQQREHSLVVTEQLRELTRDIPGVVIEVSQPEQGPLIGKDVQVEISAPTFSDAQAAGRMVRQFIENQNTDVNGETVPTYMDISDNQPLPGIEWEIVPNRAEAGRYGVTVSDIGAAVQLVTTGLIVDTFRPDDAEEELDIRLRYTEGSRNISELTQIKIATPVGSVPLSNFTERRPTQKVDRISRRDGKRVLDVAANANSMVKDHEVSQDQATRAIYEWLETGVLQNEINPNIRWSLKGAAEKTSQSSEWFKGAMLAAMFMIGVILLLQFNSFYHAALTLSAVVLSVFGVLLGVALSGQYISVIMTGVGIIALAGIVVNNNIVLIDTYHTLRKTGLSPEEATIRTAAQRLRPVLLTTITTIIGLLPMVFEINIDFGKALIGIGNETSDWWVLLSSAIVYGLAFATLLTLILTPVLLAAPFVIGNYIRSFMGNNKIKSHLVRRKALQQQSANDAISPAEPIKTAAE